MPKKIATLLVVILIICSTNLTALASNEQSSLGTQRTSLQQEDVSIWYPSQYWSYINYIANGVSVSGNTATVSCDVQGYYTTSSLKVTNTLQRYSNSSWVTVKTWSGSGKYYCMFENSTSVSSGQMLRVVTSVNVYDTAGKFLETATATSKIYYT